MKKELDGNSRRQTLLSLLSQSDVPLSGTRLGRETGVSRQVVVQDIALLRTAGYPILSTGRGYILNDKSGGCTRVFKVCHSDEQVEDELQTIVDLGGCIVDVSINPRVSGKVSAPLNIKSRRDTHCCQAPPPATIIIPSAPTAKRSSMRLRKRCGQKVIWRNTWNMRFRFV